MSSELIKQVRDRVGKIINHYQIDEIIGYGGMGAVYKATDLKLKRVVALKVIHPHLLYDHPHFKERFEIEAQSIAKLDDYHPNILKIHEYNPDFEEYYIATGYLEGETLETILLKLKETSGFLPADEIVSIITDVCNGLESIHAHGIIHRDIKPSNLMITKAGRTVIMDFGLAKLLDSDSELTQTGHIIGTTKYLSPEQVEEGIIDERTDIYSLGVVLYKMLTGKHPFETDNLQRLHEFQVNHSYQKIEEVNPKVLPFLVKITEKCLQHDPIHRYSTVSKIIEDIKIHNREEETQIRRNSSDTYETSENAENNEGFIVSHGKDRLIYYDYKSEVQKFLDLLDDIIDVFQQEKYKKTVSDDFVKSFKTDVLEIKNHLKSNFNLVVVGEFNRGKSTLINALLKDSVVTTDIGPETVTINQIVYGKDKKISACLEDGGLFPLTFHELKKETLEKLISELPAPLSCVRIEHPSEWLKGMQLVDTPGLNDFIGGFDNQVKEYLQKADAVIYVISATEPLGLSERIFLKQALRSYELSKICFVINRMDAIEEVDRFRLIDSINDKLTRVFPNSKVFGISALNERREQQNLSSNTNSINSLNTEFAGFRNYLQETIFYNRRLLQIERSLSLTEILLNRKQDDIERLGNILLAEQSQIENAIFECENQNSELKEKIKKHKESVIVAVQVLGEETTEWMSGFIDRIRTEVIDNLNDFSYSDIQKHLPFFLSEQISNALNECFDYHQALIIEKIGNTNDVLKSINYGIKLANDVELTSQKAKLEGIGAKEWSIFQEIGLIFGHSSGIIQKLLIGFAEKNLSQKSKLVQYGQYLLQSLPELKSSLNREIEIQYNKIANQCVQILENMYQQQIDNALISLKQANELQKSGESNALKTENTLKELKSYLSSAQTHLTRINEKMISNNEKIFDNL